jgi:protein CMS1
MAPVVAQTSQKLRHHGSKRRRTLTDDGNEESSKPKKVVPESLQKRPQPDGDIDESIGHMDPSLLADHIAKKTKRSFRDLSNVELEGKYLSQQIFYDTSNFGSPRDLDNLPSFVEHFSDSNEDLSYTCEIPASPHTLVIAASGLRAADLTRS